MLKKYTGATNTEIGELFEGLSYSAVAKISQNFSKQLANDRDIQCVIKKIQGQISIYKG